MESNFIVVLNHEINQSVFSYIHIICDFYVEGFFHKNGFFFFPVFKIFVWYLALFLMELTVVHSVRWLLLSH